MSSFHLSVLREGLRSFGLDPRHWTLTPAGRGRVLIRRRGDATLALMGAIRATAASAVWTEIRLSSI